MSEAPERIWLTGFVKDEYGARLGRGTISDLDHGQNPDYPEYVSADRIEELEANLQSMALDCLAADGQATEAYQAQLAAEAKLHDQTHLIKELFALLDITEQTDDGRTFHPNTIRSSRALDAEKLEQVLRKLKKWV